MAQTPVRGVAEQSCCVDRASHDAGRQQGAELIRDPCCPGSGGGLETLCRRAAEANAVHPGGAIDRVGELRHLRIVALARRLSTS